MSFRQSPTPHGLTPQRPRFVRSNAALAARWLRPRPRPSCGTTAWNLKDTSVRTRQLIRLSSKARCQRRSSQARLRISRHSLNSRGMTGSIIGIVKPDTQSQGETWQVAWSFDKYWTSRDGKGSET